MVEQNGFCMHKSNLLKNFKGEKVQYTFVCSREGHRKDRGLGVENQKHEAKNETKCDCKAFFRVHIQQRMRLSAISLVSNEIKEAYVWLLDQFLEVMKGKTLVS